LTKVSGDTQKKRAETKAAILQQTIEKIVGGDPKCGAAEGHSEGANPVRRQQESLHNVKFKTCK
jgi:hypothetical protein